MQQPDEDRGVMADALGLVEVELSPLAERPVTP
jgi:hypothetical protein